jgi:GT2 family glycosyltransferase
MKNRAGPAGSRSGIATLAPALELPCTVCALLFGDHVALARRLLESLVRFTDPPAFRLRLGLNGVSRETDRLVASYESRFSNVTAIRSPRNIFKCPMMRRLFYDEPIETKWIIWFDDDCYVRRADWLLGLGLAIESDPSVELWGSQHLVAPDEQSLEFIRTARWYRGLPFLRRSDGRAIIVFPVGGFWAVRTDLVHALGWPDPRLIHYQTDFTLAEAVRQAGKRTGHYCGGVVINAAPRRSPADTPTDLRLEHDTKTTGEF